MDIMERINIMKEYKIVDEVGYNDLLSIVEILSRKFNIELTEDNAGVMITHIAAAFGRNSSGEGIEPLSKAAVAGLQEDDNYVQASKILEEVCNSITNRLSEMEQEFVLLHLCSLLYSINSARIKGVKV